MVRDKEHGMRIARALGDSTVPVFMGLVSSAPPSSRNCFGCLLEPKLSITEYDIVVEVCEHDFGSHLDHFFFYLTLFCHPSSKF